MNLFRKIVFIFLIIICVSSIAFNILIFGSSHGTLLLKHNDEKLHAVASVERVDFEPSYFLANKNAGTQIVKEIKENDVTSKFEYQIYLDNESNLSVKNTTSIQTSESFESKTTYYKNDSSYNKDGELEMVPIATTTVVSTLLTELNVLQDLLVTDIETTENKAKMHFSFSPFYFIGIEYSFSIDSQTITFKYDLNGNLRRINIKNNDGKETDYLINYKSIKVEIPNQE